MDDAAGVFRRNFHGGVGGARGRAADEERDREARAFHLFGNVDHLVEGRRDEAGEANDVDVELLRFRENFVARDHDTEVGDLVVVTSEDDTDDVFADVVNIAFDGRDEKFSLGAGGFAGGGGAGFFGFHERREVGDGALHHAGGFDDLREKHFAGAEEVADDAHAVHERALDDVEWARVFLAAFLSVGIDELVDAFDEGVREPGFDRGVAPSEIFFDLGLRGAALGGFQIVGKFDETVGGVGAPVQEHVFDISAERGLDLVVVAEHAGVDDAHVHALTDGVVKKRGVNGFADRVVAAEGERDVGNAAGDFRAGESLLDDPRGLEEIDRVVVMLLDAGRNGEDVGIENNVFRRESEALGEEFIGSGADADFFVARGGLALFVERHDDCGGAVPHDQLRAAEEFSFAVFKRDGIDDAFALKALEARFQDGPL